MKKSNDLKIKSDTKWYLSVRHFFSFDGRNEYFNTKGKYIIEYNHSGVSGVEAFEKWDSQGIIVQTRHPNLLFSLLRTKGSVNLHIKAFAEGLAEFTFPKMELRAFCISIKAPSWFRTAIEMQAGKINRNEDKDMTNFLSVNKSNLILGRFYDKQWTENVHWKGETLYYTISSKSYSYNYTLEKPVVKWVDLRQEDGLMNKKWFVDEMEDLFKKAVK